VYFFGLFRNSTDLAQLVRGLVRARHVRETDLDVVFAKIFALLRPNDMMPPSAPPSGAEEHPDADDQEKG
jgi:hypothetical protein